MDGMSAFERQLAIRLEQMAGPDPSVDVMASVRAATTRAPRMSSQAMFSATRFVVAGVVVALFGSFLLSGVLTQPRGDEPGPAVAASASASPLATDDWLSQLDIEEVAPGVSRVLTDDEGYAPEDVANSVVGNDGAVWLATDTGPIVLLGQPFRQAFGRAVNFARGEGGTVWAASMPGSNPCGPPTDEIILRRPQPQIHAFDGETRTGRSSGLGGTDSQSDAEPGPIEIAQFAIHSDGTAWVVQPHSCGDSTNRREQEQSPYRQFFAVKHLGPAGWTSYEFGDGLPDLSCGEDCVGWTSEGNGLVITPDGDVWVGASDGLLRFDGVEWQAVRPLGGDDDHGIIGLAANGDGVLWAEIQTMDDFDWGPSRLGGGRQLARFDGEDWEVFYTSSTEDFSSAPESDYRGPTGIQGVGPDGTVWLTDTYTDTDRGSRLDDPNLQAAKDRSLPVSFDGERWRRYPELLEDWASDPLNEAEHFPGGEGLHLGTSQIAVGPDGSAWVTVGVSNARDLSRTGLYVIRPDEVEPNE